MVPRSTPHLDLKVSAASLHDLGTEDSTGANLLGGVGGAGPDTLKGAEGEAVPTLEFVDEALASEEL